jgi:YHS domain-containing protein
MNPDNPPLPRHTPVVRCIVCTKKIGPSEEHVKTLHQGMQYIVCCVSCAEKFRKEPQLYTVT